MPDTLPKKRRWRESRWGSVLLSWDFLIGVPLGLAVSVALGFSPAMRSAAPGLLIGASAVGAAISTLVLTSLTVLLTSISSEYRALLRKVPGGVLGVTEPSRITIKVGAAGALASLIAAFLVSSPGGVTIGAYALGTTLATAPGLACIAWATLGSIQITEQFVRHWSNNDRAIHIEERRRSIGSRNAG